MTSKIYVVGSSNTDMVVRSPKLPMPGETVMGGAFFMNPGGKGANQAVAAARLNGSVVFVAMVGMDVFGEEALKQFRREGLDIRFVNRDANHPSGVALIGVDANAENMIIVAPGANDHLTTEMVSSAMSEAVAGDLVLLQLEIPLPVVEYAIQLANSKKIRVLLNPAPARKLGQNFLTGIFVITPNQSEAELLTGIKITNNESMEQAAQILHNTGAQHVVITLGKRGAYLYNASGGELIRSTEVKAVDTTAAGDCFNGALAVALAENIQMNEAVHFACRAAAVSVTRLGAQSSMPLRHEVPALTDNELNLDV